jgi:hypothetical protein
MPVTNAPGGNTANAGSLANAFEVRAIDPHRVRQEVMGQHGQNNGGFELRATQETSAH